MNNLNTITTILKDLYRKEHGIDIQRKVFDKDLCEWVNIPIASFATYKLRATVPYRQLLEFCNKEQINPLDIFFKEYKMTCISCDDDITEDNKVKSGKYIRSQCKTCWELEKNEHHKAKRKKDRANQTHCKCGNELDYYRIVKGEKELARSCSKCIELSNKSKREKINLHKKQCPECKEFKMPKSFDKGFESCNRCNTSYERVKYKCSECRKEKRSSLMNNDKTICKCCINGTTKKPKVNKPKEIKENTNVQKMHIPIKKTINESELKQIKKDKTTIEKKDFRIEHEQTILENLDKQADYESMYKGIDRSICRPNTDDENRMIQEFLDKKGKL